MRQMSSSNALMTAKMGEIVLPWLSATRIPLIPLVCSFSACFSVSGVLHVSSLDPVHPSGVLASKRIIEMRPCMHRRYRQGDSGHPCAIPFVGWKDLLSVTPLTLIFRFVPEYIVFTRPMKSG